MSKFHINSKGEPGLCKASSGNCPFGDIDRHYSSEEKARAAFELSMAGDTLPTNSQKVELPKDIAFLQNISTYVYGNERLMSPERELFLTILKNSEKKLAKSNDNIFNKALRLSNNFKDQLPSGYERPFKNIPSFIFLHTQIPTFGRAVTAFEQPFIRMGIIARNDYNTKKPAPFDLEETFFKAVISKADAIDSVDNLSEAFREQARLEGWYKPDELDDVFREASKKAIDEIERDKHNFMEDVLVFNENFKQ